MYGLYVAKTDAERDDIAEKVVANLVKEVEPLLADASPFFGGSDKLTLAEVRRYSACCRGEVLTHCRS
jgi:hypothetical protein